MEQTDEVRERMHGMWSAVAGGWKEHADYVDRRAETLTRRMLDAAEVGPGQRVVELACGPGGLGLAAAERVGADGEVLMSDVAPEMTRIAAERAQGLANVSTAELDLEAIDQPDDSFDVVLCREGLMFASEPLTALREVARVLRPAGRTAIAAWGPRERNPWLGVVLDSVSEQLGAPIPPPGIPGPFALEDGERLTGLFAEAGFDDVSLAEVPVPLRAGSASEWWERAVALAGPLSQVLASLPDDARRETRDRAVGAIAAYKTEDGVEIPGVSLLVSASAPPGATQ